jgi:cytochrome b561
MLTANLLAAWVGILLGLLSGIPMGMLFHKENWLGGYDSWPRRLLRLGHISFFGIAFLNLAFVITAQYTQLPDRMLHWPSVLLIVAQYTMPAVCIMSAFWKPFRQLFFVPVISAVGGTLFVVTALLNNGVCK